MSFAFYILLTAIPLISIHCFKMASTLLAFAGGAAAWVVSLFNGQEFFQNPLGLRSGDVTVELGPLLSSAAAIHLPGSEGFAITTDRWSPWRNPEFDAIVEVTTEDDVGHAVSAFSDAS